VLHFIVLRIGVVFHMMVVPGPGERLEVEDGNGRGVKIDLTGARPLPSAT